MRPHPLDLRPIDVSSTRHECSDYQDNSAARRLELLTEHSTDVLCELREGVITYLSPNAERVSGLRPQDVVGRAFVDILHPEDASALARFAAPGWTGSIEAIFRIADASGAWQWRDARGFRDVEANGAHFAVIILRDINDRRRAEEALKQSEERANASLRAIPDFV